MKRLFGNKSLLLMLFCITSLAGFLHVNRKVIKVRKSVNRKLKKHRSNLRINSFVFNKITQNRFTLPRELEKVPLIQSDVLLGVKEIEIRNAFAPYNASIIEYEDGYLLFFRYDLVPHMYFNKIHTFIGYAKLDQDFNQTQEEFIKLDTGSEFSEDPRVIDLNGDLYLVYNDLIEKDSKRRGIHLSKVDLENNQLETKTLIDPGFQPIEKNWSPFVRTSQSKNHKIFFQYNVSHPRQLLTLDHPTSPNAFKLSQESLCMDDIPWLKAWGKPLGGTPARLVGEEYLSFFHSKFKDRDGIVWYVMGAYTFEAKSPYRVTKVSPHPILYKGIYDVEYRNTAEPKGCIIFPSGFAFSVLHGREVIHLSCGENDSATKILTFDKEFLLETLVPVEK